MQEINPIDQPEVRKALVAAGVSHQTLGHWRVRGVPLDRCAPLEAQTNQIVSRKMLRPNDWWVHWPELVAGAVVLGEVVLTDEVAVKASDAMGYDAINK